ncbi:MAG: exopolyphosphatase, partial [Actinomycetaceae bacterium]|nr:exopolyphosphatase [Actinomycetaceae bacterium]
IAALGYMHPGRVDVIGSGALIWQEVIARLALRIQESDNGFRGAITSEHDILDGLALWAYSDPQAPTL